MHSKAYFAEPGDRPFGTGSSAADPRPHSGFPPLCAPPCAPQGCRGKRMLYSVKRSLRVSPAALPEDKRKPVYSRKFNAQSPRGQGASVLTSQWSFRFANASGTSLLKVVTRRVTFHLAEIPDFQSKIRGVGLPLPFSPTGRGRGRPLARSGSAALPARVPRRVPRRGRGVKAYCSFFPGPSRLREQGKNGKFTEIPMEFP